MHRWTSVGTIPGQARGNPFARDSPRAPLLACPGCLIMDKTKAGHVRNARPALSLNNRRLPVSSSSQSNTTRTRRTGITLALIVASYLAGTVAPHASAADSLRELISEVHGIRVELAAIRREIADNR